MMNMDTNKKHTLPRAIILAACSLLFAGACDNRAYEGMEPDTPAREVPLNFNASIEKTEVAQSRTVIPMDEFTGNAYEFGMSITKSENGSEVFSGSSDMTATMKRNSGSAPWGWDFVNNSNKQSVTPVGPAGKELKVVAYYPMVKESPTNDVYTNGIPFDFSVKTGLIQEDLIYNINTLYSIPIDASKTAIPLNFRHAYTWIVLNITKYMDKGQQVKLHSVSLDNLGGSWIKNKGAIDPATGLAMDGATAGPIGMTLNPVDILPLNKPNNTPLTYEFLVPSFMDPKVGNGEIVIVLNIDGIDELFNLDKAYLNNDGDSYGFRQGYKNTYNLVYNNSSLNLTIQDWSSEVIEGVFGGEIKAPEADAYLLIDFKNKNIISWPTAILPNGPGWAVNYPPQSDYLDAAKPCLYEKYLTTVAYGDNGEYVHVNSPESGTIPTVGMKITDDINVYKMEPVYPKLQMTKDDVSTISVPWEDENGQLVAKELCRKYNGGGFHNWRLPRASELRAAFIVVASSGSHFDGLQFYKDENRNKLYWTGTEESENKAWGMFYDHGKSTVESKLVLSPYDKKTTAFVRCVRDAS